MFDRVFDFLVQIIGIFHCWMVIDVYERGVLLRLGKFVRVLEPGFHWTYPFYIDRVISENVVPRTHRMPGLAVTTTDGRAIGFDAIITYAINDVVKAVLGCEHVEDAIADTCSGLICTELSKLSWEELHTKGAPDSLTKVCRSRGWRWGVEIQAIQLSGTAVVKSIRLVSNAASEHTVSVRV